jgi:NAD(P)-dependent dehydrogenase (short-subunit alcohol dehydrogenase family)
MARVFITGSSDGLGLMAGQLLIEQGHEVVLHGRNEARRRDALAAAPGAKGAVAGDLSTLAGMTRVADEVNRFGRFDAVIQNAGIGYREPRRVETEPRVPGVFAVNVLAPYVLTTLIQRPDRLIYLSSGMHHGVQPRMDDLLWTKRPWNGASAYAREQALRRVARLSGCAALAERPVECAGARLGADQDGRAFGARRHVEGAPHPGLARGQRRSAGTVEWRLFLPPAASGAEPDRAT